MRRYLRLLATQVRMSLVAAMQYRADFVLEGRCRFYWVGWNLMPLLVLYGDRTSVAGWDRPSALVVIAWFVMVRGILEGAINPSLVDVVARIRTGSFDYVLLKPADAQFLVSTARFEPWRTIDVLGGIGLVIWAFVDLGRAPRLLDVAAAVGLLGAAVLAMYSLWILIVSAAFWVVRLDNLAFPAVGGLRRGALADPGLPRRLADRLHVRHPARADDHLPGGWPSSARSARDRARLPRRRRAHARDLAPRLARRAAQLHLGVELTRHPRALILDQSPVALRGSA